MVPVDAVRLPGGPGGRASAARCSAASCRRRRPGMVLATATDSAQPISNALYATLRDRAADAAAQPDRPAASGPRRSARCRPGVAPVPFEAIAAGPPDGAGPPAARRRGRRARPRAARRRPPARPPVPAHRVAARLALPRPGRRRRSATATPARPGGSGRSPSATPALLAPVLGHLTVGRRSRAAPSRCGSPGRADRAVVAALRAGFRLDQFPVLLCWDRPFADFTPLPADLARACSRRPHRTGPPDRTIVRCRVHRSSRLPDARRRW